MERKLLLRITIIQPPHDVTFRVQRSKTDLVPSTQITDQHLSFYVPIRLGDSRPDGSLNLLGPFAHGPVAGRFLSVNSGTLAGQADSC